MSLRINDTAPDFTAETTEGPISFHDWIGDGYAVLFSHPKDFTPVCTTELGVVAGMMDEFARRNAKVIGISVDPVESHHKWKTDIKTATGQAAYPLIGDPELKVAKLYDMLSAAAGDSSEGRTPADNATVRTVFVIGPDKKIKLMLSYPMTTGRNFDEILRAIEFDPADGKAPGGDSRQLEERRRRHHHARRFGRGRPDALRQLREGAALSAPDQAAIGVSRIPSRRPRRLSRKAGRPGARASRQ